jgi:uncharacterized membrane-anchored protein
MKPLSRPPMRPAKLGLTLALLCIAAASSAQAQETILTIIPWTEGPVKAQLGTLAEIAVPTGCRFGDGEGAGKFLAATQNIPSGKEKGVILCGSQDDDYWFVIFTFEETGLVKDDEAKSLDSKKILETLRDGQAAANDVRADQGWPKLLIDRWERRPFYDPTTNNLTWSLHVKGEGETETSVNHSVRLLGRSGVMHADVVTDPAQYGPAVDAFDAMLTEYSFLSGNKYSEWKEGEPIAAYGLVGLIAGAGAVKLGLFGKLWKLILGVFIAIKKFVIVVLVAIGAFFKKIFKKKEAPEEKPAARAPTNAYPTPSPSANAGANAGASGSAGASPGASSNPSDPAAKPRPSYRIR